MSHIPQKVLAESSKLEQAPRLELFEVDALSMGGDVYRFHNGMNVDRQPVIWKGHRYEPYPLQAQGFELNGKGPSNRPKLSLANLSGLITGLTQQFDDLVGALVTRRLVYLTHLDGVNFPAGNPHEDETQEAVSRFVIERLVSLDGTYAVFELALPCETDGALIPARMITTDVCGWEYRSADCSYTGGPVAEVDDTPTTDPGCDRCGKRLSSCKLRFGANNPLPFGGFPTSVR